MTSGSFDQANKSCGSPLKASTQSLTPPLCDRIEFRLPSELRFVAETTEWLVELAALFSIVEMDDPHLAISLDEAITNAIRHGNKYDKQKTVYICAEISAEAARFTVRDEGDGFDPAALPNPLDPDNLLKPSGRGIFLMRQLMDEVKYNERGNEVTLTKFPTPCERGAEESDVV
jgi:serine/threonine-protein kinase RsbW